MSVLAYLDPASGSLIAATVAGGMAGVGVAVKSMWRNRTARFRKSDPSGAPVNDQDTSEADVSVDSAVEYAAQDDI